MDDDLTQWPTGRLLSVAARRLEHTWEAILAEHGLTHAGLVALHCITDTPQYQREIAQQCRVTDQTMSRTLDGLARQGYVARETDPEDGRRMRVRATEEGKRLYIEIVEREQQDSRLLAGLPEHEELRRLLLALINHLETPATS
ncbi:winged helix DNA-binding protein [Hoyosella rhizosphaerae]|nr:winged helix DNA-binding protein [Hoyosella rhizosphaerae]MBN4925607.1 winged helix DNA-binding protein [Hoyosella rhizosphaerae]